MGKVKVKSNGNRFLFFELTDTDARQGRLMYPKGITEVRPNVTLNILFSNLTDITVHVPTYMVLCGSSDGMVNSIDPE